FRLRLCGTDKNQANHLPASCFKTAGSFSFGKNNTMEKILLALDAVNLNTGALDFASYLAAITKSKITGVFLENLADSKHFAAHEMAGNNYSAWQTDRGGESYLAKRKQINDNISFFKDACERRSVRCSVHPDSGEPAEEIIRESRYADLLVIDPETSFREKFEGTPTAFVKDVLKDIECPVVLAPETFEGIDEIIFTYNGSKSSMFAIKQFSYLFPQFDEKKVSLLQVDEEGRELVEERENLKEWLSSHYSSVGFTTLIGDAETELLGHLLKKENAFIVMGAYGRSAVSEIFKHNPADRLVKALNQAIFIAHY
ncbi:MAG: universal stress protein, partial [Bacteroidota bacterium]